MKDMGILETKISELEDVEEYMISLANRENREATDNTLTKPKRKIKLMTHSRKRTYGFK